MTTSVFPLLLFVAAVLLLAAVILWSKWQEKQRGYTSLYHWTTDTGKPQTGKAHARCTKKCQEDMRRHGLSEQQVFDVLYHGQAIKQNMLVRIYNGYEIGLIYGRDKQTGQYLIFTAWKQERR